VANAYNARTTKSRAASVDVNKYTFCPGLRNMVRAQTVQQPFRPACPPLALGRNSWPGFP
jgi:hypothetical protein